MVDPFSEIIELITQEIKNENPVSPNTEVSKNEIVLGKLTKSEIIVFNVLLKVEAKLINLKSEKEISINSLISLGLQNLLLTSFLYRFSTRRNFKNFKVKKDWQIVTDAS